MKKQRNFHSLSISMAHFGSKALPIVSWFSFPNLSCLAAASHCCSCQCQYCTLPCWASLSWQSGRRQSIMLPRLPSQCWAEDCSACHRRTSLSFWLIMSPPETGHTLPSLLCKSENIIVAHGNGKERTEGKLSPQDLWPSKMSWKPLDSALFLGCPAHGCPQEPGNPQHPLIFVCACFLDVDSPSFSETVLAGCVSSLAWPRGRGRVLSFNFWYSLS